MCCLINNGNNSHLKQVLQGQKTRAENYRVNTIYYDVKSCQIKKTIVNCTEVRSK